MTEREFGALRPSALIRVGLADLAQVEEDPRYRVDFAVWHRPRGWRPWDGGTVCLVCMAGSMMAMSLGADPAQECKPRHYPEPIRSRLEAIDDFRAGQAGEALATMGIDPRAYEATVWSIEDAWTADYEDDRGVWAAQMERMARVLERAEL